MNPVGIGLGFVLTGVVFLLLAYVNHDVGTGTVLARRGFARYFRRGDGPLKLSAVAAEFYGLALLLAGGSVAMAAAPPQVILDVGAPASIALVVVEVVAQLWERRKRRSA